MRHPLEAQHQFEMTAINRVIHSHNNNHPNATTTATDRILVADYTKSPLRPTGITINTAYFRNRDQLFAISNTMVITGYLETVLEKDRKFQRRALARTHADRNRGHEKNYRRRFVAIKNLFPQAS